jgi:hypothetical protein
MHRKQFQGGLKLPPRIGILRGIENGLGSALACNEKQWAFGLVLDSTSVEPMADSFPLPGHDYFEFRNSSGEPTS